MISSSDKGFLIQLTLIFVLFFNNTLANVKDCPSTQGNADLNILIPKIWCESKIHDQFQDQFTGDGIPDYIYAYTEICISALQTFAPEVEYNKTDDTIQVSMEILKTADEAKSIAKDAIRIAQEAKRIVDEAYTSVDEAYTSDDETDISDDETDISVEEFKKHVENVKSIAHEANRIAKEVYDIAKSGVLCAKEVYDIVNNALVEAQGAKRNGNKAYRRAKKNFWFACKNEYNDHVNNN